MNVSRWNRRIPIQVDGSYKPADASHFLALRSRDGSGGFIFGARIGRRLVLIFEHPDYVPCQALVDLAVARHGLRDSGSGIPVPIMFAAVPDQDAA